MADAVDDEAVERARLGLDRGQAVAGMGHELGDHRIVIDRDLAAFEHAGVVAHRHAFRAAFLRRAVFDQTAGRGQEVAGGVFGIDAAFDRPALEMHVALLDRQRLAGGDADHLLDEVDAGDEFRDRMLDLQAGVHFKEIEALVLAGDEFDRAGGIVIHGLGERDGLLAHLLAGFLVEQRRRGFLDHLLVAALDGAFALAEIDDIAVLVAQHLDFDMARVDDEFFHEDAVVAERALGFGLGARKAFGDFLAGLGDAHALAAAAGGGLENHRIADAVGDA